MAEIQEQTFESDSYRFGFLKRGWDFGLPANGGKAVFGKVIDYERAPHQEVNRYAQLAAGTSVANYAGGGVQAWNNWTDDQNREILYEDDTEYIIQAFRGIWPRQLRLWDAYPSGHERGNLNEIILEQPATINTGSYWDGIDSPIDNASKRTELLIPAKLHVRHMLFNPTAKDIMPYVLMPMRRYKVRWYNWENATDKEAIKGFADFIYNNNPRRPVHYWTPGNEPYSYGAKENLHITPVDIEALAEESRTTGRRVA